MSKEAERSVTQALKAFVSGEPPSGSTRRRIIIHCGLHTLVSAAPSFVLAILFGFSTPSQIFGMVFGVFAFAIIAIRLHLSALIRRAITGSLSGRAIHLAKSIRVAHSFSVLPGFLITPVNFLAAPDLWAGMGAIALTEKLGFRSKARSLEGVVGMFSFEEFLGTFIATFIEGWILAAGVGVVFVLVYGMLWIYGWVRAPAET